MNTKIFKAFSAYYISGFFAFIISAVTVFAQSNEIGLRLVTPTGGEVLTPGTEYQVRWSDNSSNFMKYRLEYSLNEGQSWLLIEEDLQLKEYNWRVPYSLNDNCIVKVTAYEDSSRYIPLISQSGPGVHWVEFNSTGTAFVTASSFGNVFIWNGETGKLMLDIKNSGYVPVARFSPDGTLLAIIDSDSLLVVYEAESGTEVTKIGTPSERYTHLEIIQSSAGVIYLAASGKSSVRIFDINSGQQIKEYEGYELLDAGLKTELLLLYNRNGNMLRVVNVTDGSVHPLEYAGSSEVLSAELSHNGAFVATGSRDGSTQILEVSTGELLHLEENAKLILQVEFSPNDSLLLSVSTQTNAIKVFDVASRKLIQEIIEPPVHFAAPPYLRGAHFGPDGNSIISFSGNNGIAYARLWDVATWSILMDYWHNALYLKDALINPNGKSVLTIDHIKGCLWPSGAPKEISDVLSEPFRIGYVVSVNESDVSADDSYRVFPCPASDYVTIEFNGSLTKLSQGDPVRVFAANGCEVSSQIIPYRIGGHSILIGLEKILPGIYLFEVNSSEGPRILRVVVK